MSVLVWVRSSVRAFFFFDGQCECPLVYMCVKARMNACVCVFACSCMCVCAYVCMCVFAYVCACVCVRTVRECVLRMPMRKLAEGGKEKYGLRDWFYLPAWMID